MKTKKLSKKLTLTKQTITNLEDRQQDTVRGGGITPTQITCKNCPRTYCGSVVDCSC